MMKKTFLAVCAALAISLSAHAIRAEHRLYPVKQSDGTTVMLYKNGDGHLAFYTTEDHQVVVRNSDGTLCYAQLDGNQLTATAIVCHNMAERTAEEQAFVASNTLKPSDAACTALMAPLTAPAKAGEASTEDGLGKYGTSAKSAVTSIGEPTVPVIMVQFSDRKFQTENTVEKITRFFNDEGYNEDNTLQKGSVRDYFIDQSRGLFKPKFDVVAMVTMPSGYAAYGANGSGGSDQVINIISMLREAVKQAVNQGVDFSKYQGSDGTIENLTIYYAGPGEATGGDDDCIWPHALNMTGYPSSYNRYSGYTFNSYYVGNEIYGDDSSTTLMGMGVFCHEFSHCMGLPDFYDPSYSYTDDDNFGIWSVMDAGGYANSAYAPTGYTAYERSYMGWLDIPELTDEQTVTLVNPYDGEGQMAVMFRNPSDSKEYFILENHQTGKWSTNSLGSGLLVTRFAYRSASWLGNTVNTNVNFRRARVITADGEKIPTSSGKKSHLFGNGQNNFLTQTLYNGSTLSDHQVYKIFQQGDGTITFTYKNRSNYVDATLDGNVYEKVTELSQVQDKDTLIFVNTEDETAMALIDGELTAVNIKISGDKAYSTATTVQALARQSSTSGKWTFRDVQSKKLIAIKKSGLDVQTTSNTFSQATLSMANGIATLTFGNSTLTNNILDYDYDKAAFAAFATAPGKIQLYRKVSDGSHTGISAVQSDTTVHPQNVYNLKGQFVGTSLSGLAKGIYVQNGKKVVVK